MKNKATYRNSQNYKMLHFSLIYFFRGEITPKEIAYEPLQPLGFMPITATYPMLHLV